MSYPIVSEAAARLWYQDWQGTCMALEPPERLAAPIKPSVETMQDGTDEAWDEVAAAMCAELSDVLADEGQAVFESKGAVIVHERLPGHHPALRDPDFWTWLAIHPGLDTIIERYAPPTQPEPGPDAKWKNPLPGKENFFGSSSKETLFFRLWIRAEMSRGLPLEDLYEFARPGLVDFWRSHVFRQRYARHRPFLEAFVDFQFPGKRDEARLSTDDIRTLAKELKIVCGNVAVEALDTAQSAELIERTYRVRVQGGAS